MDADDKSILNVAQDIYEFQKNNLRTYRLSRAIIGNN
jgi:hypothetical protein